VSIGRKKKTEQEDLKNLQFGQKSPCKAEAKGGIISAEISIIKKKTKENGGGGEFNYNIFDTL
jgi:hypothetical protein